jgi:hypothetical protein
MADGTASSKGGDPFEVSVQGPDGAVDAALVDNGRWRVTSMET